MITIDLPLSSEFTLIIIVIIMVIIIILPIAMATIIIY